MINKMKKMFRNDKEALKLINKADKKLCDIMMLLFDVENKANLVGLHFKELDKAIKEIKKLGN